MTPADFETARGWGAEPGFWWMPGMLAVFANNMQARITEQTLAIDLGAVPAVDDPATLGCLRALVREKRGPLMIWESPHHTPASARFLVENESNEWWGDTEAAALLAAFRGEP
jgi:hypothetical protein